MRKREERNDGADSFCFFSIHHTWLEGKLSDPGGCFAAGRVKGDSEVGALSAVGDCGGVPDLSGSACLACFCGWDY